MRFIVPVGYSVVIQGQVVYSRDGVIETNNPDQINALSQNPKAKREDAEQVKQPEQQRNNGKK